LYQNVRIFLVCQAEVEVEVFREVVAVASAVDVEVFRLEVATVVATEETVVEDSHHTSAGWTLVVTFERLNCWWVGEGLESVR
jgi:hypothetical protein